MRAKLYLFEFRKEFKLSYESNPENNLIKIIDLGTSIN